MIIIIFLLVVICAVLSLNLFVLKNQMKNIASELIRNRDINYNRKITVTHIDKNLSVLASEINKNLELQQKLFEQSERAENHLKNSVSDIAHDLRTPLTVINGSLQLMNREEKLSERGRDYLRVCCEKTDQLKKMADDFFEMSLLESGGIQTVTEKINVTALLMQFIADNEALIRTNRLEPDIEFPEKSLFINGDRQMMTRILENLLNNVIKYASGSFRISLEESEEKGSIVFSNNAAVLKEEDAEHLFERSYRADKSRTGNSAGLGLYIVRLLAEKQDGSVSARLSNGELSVAVTFRAAD